MAILLHQILNGVEWRRFRLIGDARDARLEEVSLAPVLSCQLVTEVRDREVIRPDLAVGARDRLILWTLPSVLNVVPPARKEKKWT